MPDDGKNTLPVVKIDQSRHQRHRNQNKLLEPSKPSALVDVVFISIKLIRNQYQGNSNYDMKISNICNYSRFHLLDTLPKVWMIDGHIASTTERCKVATWFAKKGLDSDPAYHKVSLEMLSSNLVRQKKTWILQIRLIIRSVLHELEMQGCRSSWSA